MEHQQWKLSELFSQVGIEVPRGKANLRVTGIADNSQRVDPGNIFVAIRGTRTNSHVFISDAIDRGASVIIVEEDIPDYNGTAVVRVDNSREILGRLAHSFYGNPTRDMLVFGVSGTNGKTTSTYLIETILKSCGYKPGVIGTIEHRYAGEVVKAANTTPSAPQLAELLATMKQAGTNAIAMEVSSHAVDQARIAGIEFNIGILTNITQDHLDYHGTMEAYAEAKKQFYFDFLLRHKTNTAAVFNLDDSWGDKFYTEFPGKKVGYSLNKACELQATSVDISPHGIAIWANWQGSKLRIESPLLGKFNVYNVLGAAAAGLAASLPEEAVLEGIKGLKAVPGRFEHVGMGQDFFVIVDYAHTPDALENVLSNAKAMTTGKVITVFGCGGDRDNRKRPLMGEVAGRMSNKVILTNDNPRTENPQVIADMAYEGIVSSGAKPSDVQVILDRRDAIAAAISLAESGDIVMIAGKGHEDYQILGNETIHFDDREVAREFLAARLARA